MSKITVYGLAALGVVSLLMIFVTHSALWALLALVAFVAISWKPGKRGVVQQAKPEEKAAELAEEKAELKQLEAAPVVPPAPPAPAVGKPDGNPAEKQAKNDPIQGSCLRQKELREIAAQREAEIKEKKIEEINKIYEEFLAGEGKLPDAFSTPYCEEYDSFVINRTPFPYVDLLESALDDLTDQSGVSEWLHLGDVSNIHTAVAELIEWISCNRKMNEIMREKSHIGNAYYPGLMRSRCRDSIMVVVEDGCVIEKLTKAEIARCRAVNLSFCTILSDRSMYDLLEKQKKVIKCEEYPGSADDAATYGIWSLKPVFE